MNNDLKLVISAASVIIIIVLLATFAKAESISVKNVECPDGTFEIVNDSLSCISCQAGFSPQNGSCVLSSQAQQIQKVDGNPLQKFANFIDEKGTSITPQQPIIGRLILFAGSIVAVVLVVGGIKKMLGGKK